ncbi:MAG: hypothetical protein ACRC54_05105 [Fusobacteriaceae bacterium]
MQTFPKEIENILNDIGNSLVSEKKVSIKIEKELNGNFFVTIAPTKMVSLSK